VHLGLQKLKLINESVLTLPHRRDGISECHFSPLSYLGVFSELVLYQPLGSTEVIVLDCHVEAFNIDRLSLSLRIGYEVTDRLFRSVANVSAVEYRS